MKHLLNRRSFLKTAGGLTLGAGLAGWPFAALAAPDMVKITVLHTNDVHSRLDPFPMDGGKRQGLGGVAKRAALIKKIRQAEPHVLLFDCGDIFQGTPYFNFFGGEPEIKLMSLMQYDAATLGNHDFDAGLDGLIKQLPHAQFPFINCNYNFSDTPLNGKTKPYTIFNIDKIKIGVTGVGIELKGLVPGNLYGDTQYLDPITQVNEIARILKEEEKCDFIICLSHLGYEYKSDKISDKVLAENSYHIDLILGGHTHTFMEQPDSTVKNKNGHPVIINQAGWAGIMLGRLDIYFEKSKKKNCVTCKNQFIR